MRDDAVEVETDDGARAMLRVTWEAFAGDAGLTALRMRLPRGREAAGAGRPVLLVHGFGQNLHAWHLPGRSFAGHLAVEGFDVFALDLRGHGRSRGHRSVPAADPVEYADRDLPGVLDAIAERSGHRGVSVLGHSLGGLVALAANVSARGRVGAVGLLATPGRIGEGNPAVLVALRALSAATRVTGARRFPMWAVREVFRRSTRVWEAPSLPMPLRAWSPGSFEPDLLERWLSLAFDHGSPQELVAILDAREPGGELSRRLDAWRAREVPTLVVAGRDDLLCPPLSALPLVRSESGAPTEWHVLPFGHGDLLLGRRAPSEVWPVVTRWLDANAPADNSRP